MTASPPPPRPELIALLDAVKDHPDDDTPRLVLADWLDEQDDPLDAERAAFIRADIASAGGRGPQPTLTPGEERDASAALFRRWLGPVAELAHTARFERGLPLLLVNATRLLSPKAHPLLATEAFAFVQFVQVNEAGGSRLEALSALPEFRHVPGVSASPFTAPGAHSATKFFGSPNLTGLRQIEFRGVRPGAAGVKALAANPALARLRKLSLVHNRLVDGAVIALAASPHLGKLEILDLTDNHVRDAGAEALAASAALVHLRELRLRENAEITDRGKQALRDKFGDRVNLD